MSRKIAVNMPSEVAYEITLMARESGLSFSTQAAQCLETYLRALGKLRPNPDRLAITRGTAAHGEHGRARWS